MSRNLLLKSGRLYAWHSSDAQSYVDISTPGIVTKTKEGGAGFATNAYLWPANDTSPNVAHCCTSLFDLANAFDCFTLSVDIKVSSSAVKASVRYDMRYHSVTEFGNQGIIGLDVSGMTEWTRVHLTVPLVQTKGKATSSLFCVFFADDSPAGGSLQWRNMKLEVGDTGSEWTPAPEDVLLSSIPESILEPGAISTGNTVVAGQTLGNMKSSDSSWMTIRVRTKNIIPLLGNRAFYINFPANLVCFPIYFDSSDLSVAAPCDAHTTKDVFIAPQGAVGVELVFKKSDNSAITPADVTNVTVGGYSLMTIKARASVEIENPSIGGRNLLKQTATKLLSSEFAKGGNSYYMEDGFCVSKVTEKWVGYEAKLSKHTPGYPFAVGDTITVSADVRGVGYTNIWAIGSREIGNTIFYPATGDTHFPISSTWERVSATFVMTQANVDWLETEGNYIRMGFENDHDAVDGSYYEFRKMKLEKGTKATDWTPAPEDVDSAISDLEDKTILNATALEQRLSSQILQTQEQIQQSVSEQYFTKDETNTLISQVSTAFTQTAEGWQMDFNKIVSIVNANQAATDSEFQEWSKYIRFVDGNIILGAVANPVVLTIKNDRISFSQSGQEVAYLSNAELVITDARVTHSLIIGKFGFIPRANGSLDFKKVL